MAWREQRHQGKSSTNPNPVPMPNRPIVEPFPSDKLASMTPMLKSLEGKGVTLVVLDTPGADNATVNAALAASDFALIPLAPTLRHHPQDRRRLNPAATGLGNYCRSVVWSS